MSLKTLNAGFLPRRWLNDDDVDLARAFHAFAIGLFFVGLLLFAVQRHTAERGHPPATG